MKAFKGSGPLLLLLELHPIFISTAQLVSRLVSWLDTVATSGSCDRCEAAADLPWVAVLCSLNIVARLARVIGRACSIIVASNLDDLSVMKRFELQLRAVSWLVAACTFQVIREEVARRGGFLD